MNSFYWFFLDVVQVALILTQNGIMHWNRGEQILEVLRACGQYVTMCLQFFVIELKSHVEELFFLVEALESIDKFFAATVVDDFTKIACCFEDFFQVQILQARSNVHYLSRFHKRFQFGLWEFYQAVVDVIQQFLNDVERSILPFGCLNRKT